MHTKICRKLSSFDLFTRYFQTLDIKGFRLSRACTCVWKTCKWKAVLHTIYCCRIEIHFWWMFYRHDNLVPRIFALPTLTVITWVNRKPSCLCFVYMLRKIINKSLFTTWITKFLKILGTLWILTLFLLAIVLNEYDLEFMFRKISNNANMRNLSNFKSCSLLIVISRTNAQTLLPL